MTQQEVTNRILAGDVCLICEYRSSRAETINWRDKESGKMLSAPALNHYVETAQGPLTVQERVDRDTFEPTVYKQPFKKGSMVVVLTQTLNRKMGVTIIQGKLEPYTS